MGSIQIKDLYGLKLAVHALSFYDIKGIDTKHLENLLSKEIKRVYSEQLQQESLNNRNPSKETSSVTKEFDAETTLHKKNIEELDWERDFEWENMMESLDED